MGLFRLFLINKAYSVTNCTSGVKVLNCLISCTMKRFLITLSLIPFLTIGQNEENEILRIKALRERFDKQVEVQVYPNPTSDGRVTIDAEDGSEVSLYNLSGHLIVNYTVDPFSEGLPQLSTGTYLLLVRKNGLEQRKKLVVL